MGILAEILAKKRDQLPALRAQKLPIPPAHVPAVALRRSAGEALRFICEIKLRSPSAGPLSAQLSVTDRARCYEKYGAHVVSVLCDSEFFAGSYEHLQLARAGCELPLLCKEFVIDECQLDAARAYGASAVLLIVRCLQDAQLSRLLDGANERGLVPLVEVFTEGEAQRALDAGATFIGVNARDLDTLHMDVARAERVVQSLPDTVVAAHLSGLKTRQDVQRVARGRADAALVGEVLMREDDPSDTLAHLVAAAST